MTCKIAVSGGLGRMGQAILELASGDDSLEVVGILEAEARVEGDCATLPVGGKPVPVAATLDELAAPRGSVLIEFSTPEATMTHVARVQQFGMKMVIGTTGLGDDDIKRIKEAAGVTAIVVAPNMSAGVNMLAGLVATTAAALEDYDVEIIEAHHNSKIDAPSGTALKLAESAAQARGRNLGEVICHGRQGPVGERPIGEIGMHAVRGGDVVGEHTVMFIGRGERIELTHRAHNRNVFAAGALRAARYLAEKETGLYSMRDVLGI